MKHRTLKQLRLSQLPEHHHHVCVVLLDPAWEKLRLGFPALDNALAEQLQNSGGTGSSSVTPFSPATPMLIVERAGGEIIVLMLRTVDLKAGS